MDDFWADAEKVLAGVAPSIASIIGGPFAGAATTAIIKALNLAPDTPPEQVASAVANASTDQLLALKKADNDFKVQMRTLDIDDAKLAYGDRANARGREVEVKDSTPKYLAFALTVGFFGMLSAACFHGFPAENKSALDIMLGALGSAWTAMIMYYFGDSFGSQGTNRLLFASKPAEDR